MNIKINIQIRYIWILTYRTVLIIASELMLTASHDKAWLLVGLIMVIFRRTPLAMELCNEIIFLYYLVVNPRKVQGGLFDPVFELPLKQPLIVTSGFLSQG
ncbi:hypothetical protein [Enterobacter hormaechei]|uniref:hypothetical protein n=1 Tax=Enterobacter hormaechei TaxID=158836 RepID=UPI0039C2AE10